MEIERTCSSIKQRPQDFKKGHKGYWLGKLRGAHSKETKERISLASKGKKFSEESKMLMSLSAKKRLLKPPSRKGSFHTLETRKLIGEKSKGRIVTKETRLKIRLAHIGEKNYNWRGGKSFEEYAPDWTKTLKESIRQRDNYTCFICNKKQLTEKHSVHHIDYNKRNCNPENLVSLCRKCHTKTNFKRENWISYFSTGRSLCN